MGLRTGTEELSRRHRSHDLVSQALIWTLQMYVDRAHSFSRVLLVLHRSSQLVDDGAHPPRANRVDLTHRIAIAILAVDDLRR